MRALAILLLSFSCLFAGIAERLSGMGFSDVRVLSRVPSQIQGHLTVIMEETSTEPKVVYFGDHIGDVDSTFIVYLGERFPVNEAASGYLRRDFYEVLTTEKFMMIFSDLPSGVEGRLFLQIITKSGRSSKYIIR